MIVSYGAERLRTAGHDRSASKCQANESFAFLRLPNVQRIPDEKLIKKSFIF